MSLITASTVAKIMVDKLKRPCPSCKRTQVEKILRALEEAGVYDENASGEIVLRPSPKAYTYS